MLSGSISGPLSPDPGFFPSLHGPLGFQYLPFALPSLGYFSYTSVVRGLLPRSVILFPCLALKWDQDGGSCLSPVLPPSLPFPMPSGPLDSSACAVCLFSGEEDGEACWPCVFPGMHSGTLPPPRPACVG